MKFSSIWNDLKNKKMIKKHVNSQTTPKNLVFHLNFGMITENT